uniref:Uncharacterized protein n=1 Tax=Rhizophora mucronata TaxID=61149 RepID=A0A2P2P8V4_RHIMU
MYYSVTLLSKMPKPYQIIVNCEIYRIKNHNLARQSQKSKNLIKTHQEKEEKNNG